MPSSACTPGTAGPFGPDRITRNVYNAAGQLSKVQRAVGTALEQDYATYTYSPNGNRTSVTDARGYKATMGFDEFDRQSSWHFPSPTTPGVASSTDYEAYGYDANGNRTSLRKRDGQQIGYAYDALNRMRLKDLPGSMPDVYYGYDARGLLLFARFGSASGAGVTHTYDGFGRLRQSSTNLSGVTRTVASDYDANGNRTRITHPDGAYFEFQITENGPLTGLVSIFYNAQGRRSDLARDSAGATTVYDYDPVSRLESMAHDLDGAGTANDVTMTFSYNPAGQIVTRTLTNDAYEFPLTSSTQTYAVNGLNQYSQVAGVAVAWDANGNLEDDGPTTFGYDVENRLTSASGAKNATLGCDPLGRLFAVTGASDTTRFVYDGNRLIAEYDGSGTLLRRYVHGTGVDEPLVRYQGATVSAGNRRYFHANHQGSIVAITGASGATLQVNAYDAYGVTSAGNTSRFQYTGQAAIPEIGLYYYKARMYNASIGRFMQMDPVGYDENLNLYSYVFNDPLNQTDRFGLCAVQNGALVDCTVTRDKNLSPAELAASNDYIDVLVKVGEAIQRSGDAELADAFESVKEIEFLAGDYGGDPRATATAGYTDNGEAKISFWKPAYKNRNTSSHRGHRRRNRVVRAGVYRRREEGDRQRPQGAEE